MLSRKKRQTASTRELGLSISEIAARYLFGIEHLHYGYWPGDLRVEIGNLRQAQENHSDLIIRHIPAGVRTILDVGAGAGAFAQRLIAAGYKVDCVSPSPYLTQRARARLGEGPRIFECRYEDLKTEERYDLILFSESFQYLEMEQAFQVSGKRLCEGGYLLICDFFRKETPDRGPFGGGHPLGEFRGLIAGHRLRILADEDITPEIAPNLDLVADFVKQVVAPARDQVFHFLSSRHPLLLRLLRRIFRRHLQQAEEKYFSGKRSGANFQIYKSYRLLLLQPGGEQVY